MIPDNVTLIVKAPNQQIEDQNIECQSTWTVKQLKGHLSEVYPSKPVSNHILGSIKNSHLIGSRDSLCVTRNSQRNALMKSSVLIVLM